MKNSPQTNALMLEAEAPKSVTVTTEDTGASIDTGKKYDRALFIFAVDNGATQTTLLKVQESDDSGMSGAADITGTVVGTDANDAGSTSTLPLHVEILYNEYNAIGAFAAASILALLALVTLVAKTVVEWRMKQETDMLNAVLAPEKT